MPQLTIKYHNPKTLKALKALSEYLDFTVTKNRPKKKKKYYLINGVPITPGDKSIDISEMTALFSGRNLDAKKLRETAWQRSK
jgi:hypothetical protein